MRSCDFEGGSWFRSTRPEEEHAFFEPESNKLTLNDGPISDDKIISIANSRRGFYFTSTFRISTNEAFVGYANPTSFWTRTWTLSTSLPSRFYHKFTRINMFSANRVYYLVPHKFVFGTTATDWLDGLRNQSYASYVDTNNV